MAQTPAKEKRKVKLPLSMLKTFVPDPDVEVEWYDDSQGTGILDQPEAPTSEPEIQQVKPDEFNINLSSGPRGPNLADIWNQANAPIVDIRKSDPRLQIATDQFAKDYPILGGGLNFSADMLSSLTSPVNIAGGLATGGANIASNMGLRGVSKALDLGVRGLGAAAAGGGAEDIYSGGSWGQRLAGGLEVIGGLAGMRYGAGLGGSSAIPEQTAQAVQTPGTIRGSAPKMETSAIQPNAGALPPPTMPMRRLTTVMMKQALKNQGHMVPETAATRGYKGSPAQTKGAKLTGGMIDKLDQADVDKLGLYINTTPALEGGFNRLHATAGLKNLLEGQPVPDYQLNLLRRAFGDQFMDQAREAMASVKGQRPNWALEGINFFRTLKSSFDLSAPLRQGATMMLNKEFWTSLDDMFKSITPKKGKQYFDEMTAAMMDDVDYAAAVDSGLAISDIYGLNNREEFFMSRLAEKIPGVLASERAYVMFLNKLRFDTFKSMKRDLAKMGIDVDDPSIALPYLKENAELINNLTGKANYTVRPSGTVEFGKRLYDRVQGNKDPLFGTGRVPIESNTLRQVGNVGNYAFYSPRFMYSRVKSFNDMLNPMAYVNANPVARQQQLKSLIALSSLWMTTLGLTKWAGGDVSMDPTSSDFGKGRFGNFRLDPGASFQQYMVFAARMYNQQVAKQDGTHVKIGGRGFYSNKEVTERFFANKYNPPIKLAWDLMSGNKTYPPGAPELVELMAPMITEDLFEIYQQDPEYLPLMLPVIFGAGSQYYGEK